MAAAAGDAGADGGTGAGRAASRARRAPAGAGIDDARPALPDPAPASYEAAVAELEDLVHGMEGGGLSLEASLEAYQRGAGLVAWCRRSLLDARQQIQVLEGELLKPVEAADSRARSDVVARDPGTAIEGRQQGDQDWP